MFLGLGVFFYDNKQGILKCIIKINMLLYCHKNIDDFDFMYYSFAIFQIKVLKYCFVKISKYEYFENRKIYRFD